MGVKHQMVSESKSKCGRQVTQGAGADCKNCARVEASRDAWAGKPAADMVAVATDVPGVAEYVSREVFVAQVAEAAKPRAKSATPKSRAHANLDTNSAELSEDLGDAAEANAQDWAESGHPRDENGAPTVNESAPIELPEAGQWIMWQGFSYMVESRYSDGKMALKPYGGYKVTIPDRPIAQLMFWGEVKWPTHACKTCGPRSSAWCTNCYECDHWGRPVVEATEVQATQVARATVAVIDVAAREAFELSKIDAVELPADPFRGHPDYAGEGWQVPYENLPKAGQSCADELWHGTDTCLAHPDGTVECRTATVTLLYKPAIKPPVRTCLSRRKRKATKRARRLAQGTKGGK